MKNVYFGSFGIALTAALLSFLMKDFHISGWREMGIASHFSFLLVVLLLPVLHAKGASADEQRGHKVLNATNVGSLGGALVFAGMLMKDFHIHGSRFPKAIGAVIVLIVFLIVLIARMQKKKQVV